MNVKGVEGERQQHALRRKRIVETGNWVPYA